MKITFSVVASILPMLWPVLVIRLTYFRKFGRFHELEPEPKVRDPPDLCVCLCGPTGRWCIRSISVNSPSFCKATCCSSLTKPTALLPQSHDSSSYVSRPILAPPPLWLHKHTDLRAHDFAHSPDLWLQPRLAKFTCAWSWKLRGNNLGILHRQTRKGVLHFGCLKLPNQQ
jgi:hypothetical protein